MFRRIAVPAILIASALALFAQACDNPAREKTELTVREAQSAPAEAPARGGVRYAFDARTSKVSWVGSKVTGSHDGGFGRFSGTVDLVAGKPEKSSVRVELDATSLYSDNPKLTKHLKSADFFDVERYPKVVFTSTAIAPASGDATHQITGNLELHGVEKSVTFPAKLRATQASVEGDAEFTFNRRDFGIDYAGMANDLIRDEVVVRLQIRAQRGAS